MKLFHQAWSMLRVRAVNVRIFDLFLQGALLITLLLEHNAFLLLRRDADNYLISMRIEDWAIIGLGCLELLVAVLVAWCGRERRKLALSLWLAATALLGLIVLAFSYDRENLPLVELCGHTPIPELSETSVSSDTRVDPERVASARAVSLVATLAACSLTRVSLWAHGLTHLDDHLPQNGPFYYGMLITIQLSLGLTGKEWLRYSANRAHWWIPHLAICLLTLMFAVLYQLLPDVKERHNEDVRDPLPGGLWTSLKRLLRNQALMVQIGALGFLNAALYRFFHYDREFIQARYHIDILHPDLRSSLITGSIFRPIVIIFFIMIFRIRFSVSSGGLVPVRTAARTGAILALAAAAFLSVIAAMHCAGPIEGLDQTYTSPACSASCGCNTAKHGFMPVCGLGASDSFLTPCEAGCRSYDNFNDFLVFRNCSCVVSGATRGACFDGCLVTYALYQVFLALILAIAGASLVLQGTAVLRGVLRMDKPLVIGLMMAVVAGTAQFLGHMVYNAISSKSCAFYNAGRCEFHNESLGLIAVVSAVLAAVSGMASLLASYCEPGTGGLLDLEDL